MIRIRIDMIDFVLQMDGHAEAPREGDHDLVCCAASTIGQQYLYSLERWNGTQKGLKQIDREMESGRLYIRVKAEEWARIAVHARLQYAMEGFEMLQERYPEYISIEEV